jgi:hypothetical protein
VASDRFAIGLLQAADADRIQGTSSVDKNSTEDERSPITSSGVAIYPKPWTMEDSKDFIKNIWSNTTVDFEAFVPIERLMADGQLLPELRDY